MESKKFTLEQVFDAIGKGPLAHKKATEDFYKDREGINFVRNDGIKFAVSACALGNAALELKVNPSNLHQALNGYDPLGDFDEDSFLYVEQLGDEIAKKNDETTKSLPVLAAHFKHLYAAHLDDEIVLNESDYIVEHDSELGYRLVPVT